MTSSARFPATIHKLLWWLLAFALVAVAALQVQRSWRAIAAPAVPLEVIKDAPTFAMVDHLGQPFTDASLRGKVWVANFVFTTCPGPCPLMTQRMLELQQALLKTSNVRLVSFTVLPEVDTVDVLAAYAKRHHANPDIWRFVRGERDATFELAQKGFYLTATEARPEDAPVSGPVVHDPRFALVDAQGRIRGYFNSLEPDAMPRLLTAIGALLREAQLDG